MLNAPPITSGSSRWAVNVVKPLKLSENIFASEIVAVLITISAAFVHSQSLGADKLQGSQAVMDRYGLSGFWRTQGWSETNLLDVQGEVYRSSGHKRQAV